MSPEVFHGFSRVISFSFYVLLKRIYSYERIVPSLCMASTTRR